MGTTVISSLDSLQNSISEAQLATMVGHPSNLVGPVPYDSYDSYATDCRTSDTLGPVTIKEVKDDVLASSIEKSHQSLSINRRLLLY